MPFRVILTWTRNWLCAKLTFRYQSNDSPKSNVDSGMRELITKIQTLATRRKLSLSFAGTLILLGAGAFAAINAPPSAFYSIEQSPLTRYGSPLEQGLRRFPPIHSAIWAAPPFFA